MCWASSKLTTCTNWDHILDQIGIQRVGFWGGRITGQADKKLNRHLMPGPEFNARGQVTLNWQGGLCSHYSALILLNANWKCSFMVYSNSTFTLYCFRWTLKANLMTASTNTLWVHYPHCLNCYFFHREEYVLYLPFLPFCHVAVLLTAGDNRISCWCSLQIRCSVNFWVHITASGKSVKNLEGFSVLTWNNRQKFICFPS